MMGWLSKGVGIVLLEVISRIPGPVWCVCVCVFTVHPRRSFCSDLCEGQHSGFRVDGTVPKRFIWTPYKKSSLGLCQYIHIYIL